ncbi:DUF1800 family protein [Algisphaera agarilytica]|uniref:Uncharacterized protein (DUF1800 family) n=1 Tax=Algisphaera agarilytica TaxID=1385975 RepID=A0A7X0H8M5_9BACT|nr:DUF1800 family protein [Algisphaera agarilytica]MBB6429835.1 uncharacterized protein (DUF1800 family) [Algisphaera agarilytica]
MMRRVVRFAVVTLAVGISSAVAQETDLSPRINASAHLGVAPLEVAFDASRSTTSSGKLAGYRWTLGQETLGTGPSIQHVFQTPGTHELTLHLTSDAGHSATQSIAISVAEQPWKPSKNITRAEAQRFLWQAAFGPTEQDVEFVMRRGFEAWIDKQLAMPASLLTDKLARSRENEIEYDEELEEDDQQEEVDTVILIDDLLIGADDQLRQRMAWALVQVLPINAEGAVPEELGVEHGHRALYNVYLRHALPDRRSKTKGNYLELLDELTFNSGMAQWLTYKNNAKANAELGTTPDENYAREVMQLFTIGLHRLNPDGTPQRDADGQPIPNYTNQDVEELARVFTGLIDGEIEPEEEDDLASAAPARWVITDHDFGPKRLLDYPGASKKTRNIPAASRSNRTEARAVKEVRVALRHLFNHPSHPPFIAHRLIQRFTTSNPTPGYVQRVAEAYQGEGPYGKGQRGDLGATIKAILLDDEARNPAYRDSPYAGLTLEPMRVMVGVARAFELHQPARYLPRTDYDLMWEMDEFTGQGFLNTPSVFNFYLPTYTPVNTELAATGMAAPELQLMDEYRAIAGLEFITASVLYGLEDFNESFAEQAYDSLEDPEALVDLIAQRLDHGGLAPETRSDIATAVSRIRDPDERLYAAVYLTLGHPAFRVLH